ncbi:RNA polymerase sigma factor [Neobacillus sp. NPDC093182]|uniref:RNA polymerase sigma factor n=1 Tax=Neobacillus sp. NPDC093182 TaxID=3364297 RepID=UPI00382F505B
MSEQLSDSSYLSHSKEQIEKTIEEIIAAYDENLRYSAFRFVRDWELVNDILQEVYLKVFKNINILMNSSAIKSWLYSITANQCKDYLRTKYCRTTILTDDFEVLTQKSNLVEIEVLEKLDKLYLQKINTSLPKHYKDPLILKYYYHYNYMEISEKLNISIQCLKTRIHRAKKMVKEKYYFQINSRA